MIDGCSDVTADVTGVSSNSSRYHPRNKWNSPRTKLFAAGIDFFHMKNVWSHDSKLQKPCFRVRRADVNNGTVYWQLQQKKKIFHLHYVKKPNVPCPVSHLTDSVHNSLFSNLWKSLSVICLFTVTLMSKATSFISASFWLDSKLYHVRKFIFVDPLTAHNQRRFDDAAFWNSVRSCKGREHWAVLVNEDQLRVFLAFCKIGFSLAFLSPESNNFNLSKLHFDVRLRLQLRP